MLKITNFAFKITLSFLFIACITLNACKKEDKILQSGEAKLRIINASPEANEFSFFINDSLKTGQALKFGESSSYIKVSAGPSNVVTKLANNVIENTSLALFLSNNANYTLFLTGKASKDSLVYLSTSDNLSFVSDTMATVRFINTSPNSPNLNLVFQNNLIDSINVISSINYRSASSYIKVKPNTYFMRIKKTGSTLSSANLDNYTLEARKIYTFWAKGTLKEVGAYALQVGVLKDN